MPGRELSRRSFLKLGALSAVGAASFGLGMLPPRVRVDCLPEITVFSHCGRRTPAGTGATTPLGE